MHDVDADVVSEDKPLQVWFKWAEWENCSHRDYEDAFD
jgi:hypothetical protein